ncbi:MAG: tRNA (N6-isopentenyl adenosine(37)-C2)-methylthiotransferase MiaB [Bacteroidetes bacterium GWF2_42_66]|nr:MAG: tRNA (N6-isopentenyl adenosine(37)-C2)-methylthiotransferase MiaB [Bacteroidetes bacterium GWA2_42_15]OFY02103.1 MAG: tRNA (N6-isopentenyl adenosine(37)-C2)-methylthiotransferase MiaB [Bacteroidetes bacterium GWE2_42_39]OFY43450.1 MAG: tRNA (N6-isopentenyl adenosine(37)-C2)-methylthiotransferase MiaB [Bacteroidetes bacterium GWF2_42_66]HBL76535.1 tRNA (N6-isopentenyl adenosine(37)-C2)-methylthiotransferase MiaB [Prolixibacteraceae bacterium]HCR92273.1 tRNA (N6-isopentenyl adenosine(37)-
MKYHLITLGCQMNISDSERVSAVLEKMGYQKTDNEEEANILGILACSVRQKPIDKVYNKIARWNRWKNKRNLITFVSGCVLPADKEKFLKTFDFIFPMSELAAFPDMIREYGIVTPAGLKAPQPVMPKNEHIVDLWHIQPKYQSTYEAFVPIQNGCDKFCTFCAVPYTRGREVSRPSGEILEEVRHLVNQGYKSITLLGQNVNSYGLDKNGEEITFAELLRLIGEYGKQSGQEFWVYFTSPHPQDMTREVIEVVASYNCLAKQIHLPMQSGDERVLIKMNRRHSMDKYRKIVADIRELIPQATLFTDIIVGFTSESEPEFQNTVAAMHEFKFNMAYIAMYSPRPGAASYRWENEVQQDEKKRRFHELSEVMKIHTREYNQSLLSKTLRILVNGTDRKTGFSTGLTEGKISVRLDRRYDSLNGQIVDVKITGVADFSVSGEKVQTPALPKNERELVREK